MRIRWQSTFAALVLLASLCCAGKERISILDFTRLDPLAKKSVTESEIQDLTQQVRDVATGLLDTSRFEVMTRENILVMLPPGKKDLSECEGQCEVETARNLGSRWHVVGDVKKVGTRLVLSVRLYDVVGGTQLGGVRAIGSNVDALVDAVSPKARELLAKIPGLILLQPATVAPVVPSLPVTSVPKPAEKPKASAGMVAIPAGCFEMGSPSGVGDGDEHPQHRVCLSGFSMDRTDVTNASYRSFGATPHYHDGSCYRYDGSSWTKGSVLSSFQGNDQPVVCVDWSEAKSYCESQGKRLPTEAEWEYAARAGTTTKWYWGDDEGGTGQYAWYSGNSGNTTHPVGQKPPNAWGLYDMAGNVWQWTADWYSSSYSSGEQQNPTGPGSGSIRVNRGGSWDRGPDPLRSAFRNHFSPDNSIDYLGFRCVGP